MTFRRSLIVSTACIATTLSLVACSKSDSAKPAAVALFSGCPVSSETEDYPNVKNGDPTGSATPQALFSNSPTRLYAVGSQKVDGQEIGLVRVSNDGGVSWSTFDKSVGPKGQGAIDNAIVADPSNANIYIAQTYKNGSLTSPSIHYSNDGGQTFKDAPFQLNNQNKENLKSAALTSSGKPYFVGNSVGANNETTGFIITLENDKAVLVRFNPNIAYSQIMNSGPGLLVAGTNKWDGKSLSWHLEGPSGDDKVLSILADSFPAVLGDQATKNALMRFFGDARSEIPALAGSATSLMVAQSGDIYQGGTVSFATATDPSNSEVWVIRKSTDGGKTFSVSDTFKDPQFKSSKPLAMTYFDGHPVAVGASRDEYASDVDKTTQSHWHWQVRYAPDSNSKWVPLARIEMSQDPNETAQAVGVAGTDTKDGRSLIILGNSHEGSGVHHWRVEKISSCVRPH